MEDFIVHYIFSTQTGPNTFAHVSAYLPCKNETTVEDIMKWVKSKSTVQPISITISKVG